MKINYVLLRRTRVYIYIYIRMVNESEKKKKRIVDASYYHL